MTDPVLLLVAVSSFGAGVTVGWLLSASHQTRKVRMPKSSFTPRDVILISLVLVALAVNGAVGFLQIENGRQDRERTECSIRFNERLGLALDERAARATDATMAELDLWDDIRAELADVGPGGPTGASDSIGAYMRELRASQKSRVENPYPPADLCRGD